MKISQEELSANNLLIINFRGGKFIAEDEYGNKNFWMLPRNGTIPAIFHDINEEFFYHSSWSWLHSLLEDIKNKINIKLSILSENNTNICMVSFHKKESGVVTIVEEDKDLFVALYNTLIKTIKDYER